MADHGMRRADARIACGLNLPSRLIRGMVILHGIGSVRGYVVQTMHVPQLQFRRRQSRG
jgi:hypothetical protein